MTRLDEELVRRGLASSQGEAARFVLAGLVYGASARYDTPGQTVGATTELYVKRQPKYVSRGGLKLEGALEAFHIEVTGLSCADIGASTGGFTDCLLQHGAKSVLAVDVGYGQFAWRLRQDERVTLLERTNAKSLVNHPCLKASFDLVVLDISFGRAASFFDVVSFLLKPQGKTIVLVKPQFEAAPCAVDAGGVVRQEPLIQALVNGVVRAAQEKGFMVQGVEASCVRGAKGNQEYALFALKGCDEARLAHERRAAQRPQGGSAQ